MGVPEDIRKVPRPKNTIVDDNKRDTMYRYAVRERAGAKYVPGENPKPRNGNVIGHIIDHKFVPVDEKTSNDGPVYLSYGAAALFHSLSMDIFDDLLAVYPPGDVAKIMVIAGLRIIRPGVSARRMSTHYEGTFLCQYYPGAALSESTICHFLKLLGQDEKKRVHFYQLRMQRVLEDHHVAIDGMLKEDTSTVNTFSALSRKARVKGCRNISLIYAYDLTTHEAICAEVFPGNCIDATAYKTFICDNDIRRGIIVADKGFPPSQIKEELEERPELHFLTPLKRNDTRIKEHHMIEYMSPLQCTGKHMAYKKCEIRNNRFLYAFRDHDLAAAEEKAFLEHAEKKNIQDPDAYEKEKAQFGTIVFESDEDMDPLTAYLCYDDRWELETVFEQYKNDICVNTTRVQNDDSVTGSEFINFICTIVECRIRHKAQEMDLFKDLTYADLMADLNMAVCRTDAPYPPKRRDKYWRSKPTEKIFEEMEALGLSEGSTQSATKNEV